jgi:hypothetical protein
MFPAALLEATRVGHFGHFHYECKQGMISLGARIEGGKGTRLFWVTYLNAARRDCMDRPPLAEEDDSRLRVQCHDVDQSMYA